MLYNHEGYKAVCKKCGNIAVDYNKEPTRCNECGYLFILDTKDEINIMTDVLRYADEIDNSEAFKKHLQKYILTREQDSTKFTEYNWDLYEEFQEDNLKEYKAYLEEKKSLKDYVVNDMLGILEQAVRQEKWVNEHHLMFIKDVLDINMDKKEFWKLKKVNQKSMDAFHIPVSIKLFVEYDNNILKVENPIDSVSYRLLCAIENIGASFVRCTYDMNRKKLSNIWSECHLINMYYRTRLNSYCNLKACNMDEDDFDYDNIDLLGIIMSEGNKLRKISEKAEKKKEEILKICRKCRDIEPFSITCDGNFWEGYTYRYKHFFYNEMIESIGEGLDKQGKIWERELSELFSIDENLIKNDLMIGSFIVEHDLAKECFDTINKIERNENINLENELLNVTGLPFGIITNSFLNAAWYSVLNESKKIKEQNEAKNKARNKTFQMWKQVEAYYRLVWIEIYDKKSEKLIYDMVDRVIDQCYEEYAIKKAKESNIFRNNKFYGGFREICLKIFSE